MTLFRPIAALTVVILLAACEQTAAPPPAPAEQAPAAAAPADAPAVAGQATSSTLATSRPVSITVDGANEAVFLAEGEAVTYRVLAPSEGALTGVGVQIGNFGGSSEGEIGVRVCQQDVCREGSAPLAGSVDNSSLGIALDSYLEVAEGPVELRVSRKSGYNPFAVWAYPAETGMTLPDGSEAKKVLNTVLFYEIR